MVIDKVAADVQEEEQSAVSARASNRRARCSGGIFLCFIPRQVCLRKEANCEKGDAQ